MAALSWVETSLGRLRVTDGGGREPAVVLVHSLGGTHRQWARQLDHLRPTRRAVALDLPGHGESSLAADGIPTLDSLAAGLGRVFERLGLGRVILVGHSFGGGVATACARRDPDGVAGLLLVDPIGEQSRAADEMLGFLSRVRAEGFRRVVPAHWREILDGAEPWVRDRVLEDLAKASPRVVTRGLEATLDFRPAEDLERYSGPVRVIRTRFNDYPYSLHNVVAGVAVDVVEGTSHWLHMDRPLEFNRRLDAFIEAVEAVEDGDSSRRS